jgi:hypothetical protein
VFEPGNPGGPFAHITDPEAHWKAAEDTVAAQNAASPAAGLTIDTPDPQQREKSSVETSLHRQQEFCQSSGEEPSKAKKQTIEQSTHPPVGLYSRAS